MIALLLKAYTEKQNVDQELAYVLSDLELSEDAYGILTALAGMTSTSVVILSQFSDQDPLTLWEEILTTINK